MASIVAVRAGLQANLDTISGLRVMKGVDAVVTPAAVVGELEIDFDGTFGRGLDTLTFTIRLYVSKADDRSGLETLDGYLDGSSATSVKTALESDKTLSGAAETLRVERMTGYGVYTVGANDYLGAEFTVTVYARGA